MDRIRLKMQTPVMASLSDYLIDLKIRSTFGIVHENNFFSKDPDMISWKELKPYISNLKRWDIVFTDADKYISNIVIPWNRKHVLIYLWNWKIIDATSKWVAIWEIKDIDNLSRGSLLKWIIAFRPNLSDEEIENMISFAKDQVGKPYDFDYDKSDKSAYYCSEFVADGLSVVWIDITYDSESIWKRVVSPEDMVNYIMEVWIKKSEFKLIFYLTKDEENILINKNEL